MVKEHVQLSECDREHLEKLVAQEKVNVKVFRRAKGLLLLDQGHTLQRAAEAVGVNYNSVAKWRDRYKEAGLGVLEDAPKSGRPIRISGEERAKITALACSTPPVGHARWSLRLLADKAVELGLVESISHDGVRGILKKTLCSRTASRRGASAS